MTLKAVFPTISFYIIAALAVTLGVKYSPSGPCTPGIGIMLFLFLIPLVVFILLKNIYKALFKNKENWALVIIHAVVISIIVVLAGLKVF